MVVQSAWRTEYHMRSVLTEHTMLIHCSTSAIASLRTDARTHAFKHSVRLHRQFTSRHDDQCLHLITFCIQHLHKRKQIG